MLRGTPLPALVLRRAHLLCDRADPRVPRVRELLQVFVRLVVSISVRVGEETGRGMPACEELGGWRNLAALLPAAEPKEESEEG